MAEGDKRRNCQILRGKPAIAGPDAQPAERAAGEGLLGRIPVYCPKGQAAEERRKTAVETSAAHQMGLRWEVPVFNGEIGRERKGKGTMGW